MRPNLLCFFLIILGLLYNKSSCWASHIVGGQIEMKALSDIPGHFTVSITYYFDENQSFQPFPDPPLPIYRKRDNLYMGYVQVFNQTIDNRPKLTFINQSCVTKRNLAVSVVRYTGEIQLDPKLYNDPQGYYITYQTCCRNGGIDNIQRPIDAGYVFYLEFPPLLQNGKHFINSSPIFEPIDGEYICLGQPFTFDFDAKDPDGDELKYSIVTPLQGFQSNTGNLQVRAGPYPEVSWQTGYSPMNMIPGNPALQIDPRTGQLSVTATKEGLFVFTVLVEEYRKGQRIGSVRRDYQFLVIDCPPTSSPDPTITVDNQPTTAVSFCEGRTTQLQSTANPDWVYQWKKDGLAIPGATSPTLQVAEVGTYQLITSLTEQCAKTQRSKKIVVSVTKAAFRLSPDSLPPLCQSGGRIQLQGLSTNQYQHTWYKDGKPLVTDGAGTLSVQEAGSYWTTVQDTQQGCVSRSDTAVVRSSPLLQIALSTPANATAICTGDSLWIQASLNSRFRYQWLLNDNVITGANSPRYSAHQVGSFAVEITDSLGCQATSQPVSVSVIAPLFVSIDSIPPLCQSNTLNIVRLIGQPAGGLFSGAGVSESSFSPASVGPGRHRLRYTVKQGELACQQVSTERDILVQANPTLHLDSLITMWRGNSVQLPVQPEAGYTYQWSPNDGLDDETRANAVANPAETTRYILQVSDRFGCSSSDTITVQVYERIWIPDAFSPNGDGINDSWVLRGIEAYPDAEVMVYDRWGEVVYYSKGYRQPFDGRYKGQLLSTGVYTYTLRVNSKGMLNNGKLVIL